MDNAKHIYVRLDGVLYTASIRMWLSDPVGQWEWENIDGTFNAYVFYPGVATSEHWSSVLHAVHQRLGNVTKPLRFLDALVKPDKNPYKVLAENIIVSTGVRRVQVPLDKYLQEPNAGRWEMQPIGVVKHPVFITDESSAIWKGLIDSIRSTLGQSYLDTPDNDIVDDVISLINAVEKDRVRIAEAKPHSPNMVEKLYFREYFDKCYTSIVTWKLTDDGIPMCTKYPANPPFSDGAPLSEFHAAYLGNKYYSNEVLKKRAFEQEGLYLDLVTTIQTCSEKDAAIVALDTRCSYMAETIKSSQSISIEKRNNMLWDLKWAKHAVTAWIEEYMSD